MLRQRGYTTWILKSALLNPKVFIVCHNMSVKHVKDRFSAMVYELNRESLKTSGRNINELYTEWPKFISMDRVELSIRGYDQFIPVIFDNSCYC